MLLKIVLKINFPSSMERDPLFLECVAFFLIAILGADVEMVSIFFPHLGKKNQEQFYSSIKN